jgi:polysaccharide biosynthesis protein PslJ
MQSVAGPATRPVEPVEDAPADATSPSEPPTNAPRPAASGHRRRRLPNRLTLRQLRGDPGWPLTALLSFFPLWWLLGLGEFAFALFTVPMWWSLLRRGTRVKLPPYFGVWVAYLVWAVAGGALIGLPVPGTLPASGGPIGFTVRLINLLAATGVLLYVGNRSERALPQSRILRLLSGLFLVTVIGGLLGVLVPHLQFTSPFELVLPHALRSNYYVHQLVHPGTAQVQDVLGFESPRPKAPFAYTNTWGNNLSILLAWFLVGRWARASLRRRLLTLVILGLAVVPVIYSLNRGLWIGFGLSLLYVAVRAFRRGRLGLLLTSAAIAALLVGAAAASPLGDLVSERLAHPHSNDIRATLNAAAVVAAERSPIVGWGTSRSIYGSPSSIGVGKSADCPTCGNAPIGSTGELWTLLIANGFVGAALFFAFFVLSYFRYRNDPTPIGAAGNLVLLLAPFYSLFYTAMPGALYLSFLSIALLWRNEMARREPAMPTGPTGPSGPTEPAGAA